MGSVWHKIERRWKTPGSGVIDQGNGFQGLGIWGFAMSPRDSAFWPVYSCQTTCMQSMVSLSSSIGFVVCV